VKIKFLLALAIGLLCGAALACGLTSPRTTGTPPVAQLMPDLPGFRVVEGEAIKDYVATLTEGAALLSGHPHLVLMIERVDGIIGCYQDVGAVKLRAFSDESFPLSSGVIAIADRSLLTDPATFLYCAGGRMGPASAQATLSPCSHDYTLEKDGNEFQLFYAGTTQEICHTFCANLEGCTGH
jgi:hypothetical protein